MKNKKYLVVVALSIGLVTSAIMAVFDMLLPYIPESVGDLKWVLVGLGAGITGSVVSTAMSRKMYKDNPELARRARINGNDERYIQIRKTAAYYMWFVTMITLVVMALVFVTLNLEVATWIALTTLAIHIVLYIVFLLKLNKTM